MDELSFFIIRKIRQLKDNDIWKECVKNIRKFYFNEHIYIIDDLNILNDLNYDTGDFINIHFLNTDNDLDIKGSGEFACFYYYRKLMNSKRAFFIQDSFFILKPISFDNIDIRFLFGFIDNQETYKSLVNNLILELNEGDKIIQYKYKYNWVGCFGVSCLISLDYLLYLETRYNLFILLKYIKNKILREVFERLFGLLITYDKKSFNNISLFGLKGNYDYDYNKYLNNKLDIPYFNFHQHQLEK